MSTPPIIPVILSGGCGSRLWPMSRQDRPKQFLKLINDFTLFQSTIIRALKILRLAPHNVVTVTHKDLKAETIEQMLDIDPALTDHILSEPNARNTSAAILYAALYVRKVFGPESLIWVLPSDHHIGEEAPLAMALEQAVPQALQHRLVTFGIKPDRAETQYGYIKKGPATDAHIFGVEKFVEKPDLEKAKNYTGSNDYLWNSGIYLMHVQDVIDAFSAHCEETLTLLKFALSAPSLFKSPSTHYYAQIKKEPFEKVILERSNNVCVVETDPQWSDIGSWSGLWEASDKNAFGNVTEGRVLCKNTTGSIIKSDNGRLITCIGVKDLVISDTEDAVMIAHKDSADELKHVVNTLNKVGSPEAQKPLTQTLAGDGILTHTIIVNKGEQYEVPVMDDAKRLFIVLSGTANFTCDGECSTLNTQDTVQIPAHAVCSFSGSKDIPLTLLELYFNKGSDFNDTPIQNDISGNVRKAA